MLCPQTEEKIEEAGAKSCRRK